MFKVCCYTVITFFLSLNNSSANEMKLTELIKIAEDRNELLLMQKEKNNQVSIEKNLIKAKLYPTLNFQLNALRNKDAVFSGSARMGGDAYNFYQSQLRLVQNLYVYGSLSSLELNNIQEKNEIINYEMSKKQIKHNLITAFYQYILNRNIKNHLEKSRAIMAQSLKAAEDRYQTGRGQLLDVLQIKTEYELINPELVSSQKAIDQALSKVNYYLSNTIDDQIQFVGDLKLIKFNDVINLLKNNHSVVLEQEALDLKFKSLQLQNEVEQSSDYPSLKLVGDYLFNNYKKSDLFSDPSHSWAISLQLSIPLFSGFSSHFTQKRFLSEKSQLQYYKRDLEKSLALNQIQSEKNIEATEASLKSALSALSLAEKSQVEALKNYKLATIDLLQYLKVEQSLLQAQKNIEILKHQSIMHLVDYFYHSGFSIDELVKKLE